MHTLEKVPAVSCQDPDHLALGVKLKAAQKQNLRPILSSGLWAPLPQETVFPGSIASLHPEM